MPTYTSGIEFASVSGYFAQNIDNVLGSVPAKGTVTIVPEPFVISGNSGYGQVGAKTVIQLVDGRIVNPNTAQPFVPIIATNSANIEPTDFTYTAYLDFEHLDGVYSFAFVALKNTTVDLSTALPVDPSRGIFVGPEAILAQVDASVTAANAAMESAQDDARDAAAYSSIASSRAAEAATSASLASSASLSAQDSAGKALVSETNAQRSADDAAHSAENSDSLNRIHVSEKGLAGGVAELTTAAHVEPATVPMYELPLDSIRALVLSLIDELNGTTPPPAEVLEGGDATTEATIYLVGGNAYTESTYIISGGSA